MSIYQITEYEGLPCKGSHPGLNANGKEGSLWRTSGMGAAWDPNLDTVANALHCWNQIAITELESLGRKRLKQYPL